MAFASGTAAGATNFWCYVVRLSLPTLLCVYAPVRPSTDVLLWLSAFSHSRGRRFLCPLWTCLLLLWDDAECLSVVGMSAVVVRSLRRSWRTRCGAIIFWEN